MANTPNINIQNGQITGALQVGQVFFWYNPTGDNVTLRNCGTWCDADSYTIAPYGYTQASVLLVPNTYACAFTTFPNEWNAPGMPHVSVPPQMHRREEEETAEDAKEVA